MSTPIGCLTPQGREQSIRDAKTALEEADAITLHRLFELKSQEVEVLIKGLNIVSSNMKEPRAPQTDSVILAMRDVALAAIALAEKTATTKATSREVTK